MKSLLYPSVTSKKLVVFSLAFMLMLSGVIAKAQTYTIAFPNVPPATSHGSLDQNDGPGFGGSTSFNAIETGVRFRVTQSGNITAIRFLKGDLVTGTHIGHLWTNTGTKLAEATFSESANGWQEVTLSPAVHITPGNTYVASVYSDIGDYAAEPGGTTWQGGTDYGTDPIKVIADGNEPNGLYEYLNSGVGITGIFPTQNPGAANFWIDIRFDPDFALPVTLSDFRAAATNSTILLNWKTESEYNSRGFEIQRSNNSTNWYPVSFVNGAGAGESTITRNYNYTDKNLAPGVYYYRLKQSDFDGKSTFSSIVTASIAGKGQVSLFQNTPNPFSGTTSIRFDLPRAQRVKLSVFDMTGRLIKVLTDKKGEAGSHLVTFDAANLRRELYLLKLQTEDGNVLVKTILVQ